MSKRNNVIEKVRDIFSLDKIEQYKKIEWGPLVNYADIYLNNLKNHFSDEEPNSLFLLFPTLDILTSVFKFSYSEQAVLTAYVLSRNLTYLSDLTEEKIKSGIDSIKGYYPVTNSDEELTIKMKQSRDIISCYINEQGEILAVNISEIDVAALKSTIFLLSEAQISNLLFFCKKKYDKCQKSNILQKHEVTLEKTAMAKTMKRSYINIKKYLDNDGKVKRILTNEEITELVSMLKSLGYKEEFIARVLKESSMLNNEAALKEKTEKLEHVKMHIFTEKERSMYLEALLILEDSNKIYVSMQKQIQKHLEDINSFLNGYSDVSDEEKMELEELIHLAFGELNEIIENVHLIENGIKLSRNKPE